ncbi:MAG: hypothetical protein ABR574_09130 [Cryomorphaceae bacterium]|nr:hypothetical protein [Flavobacteriales bacterium]
MLRNLLSVVFLALLSHAAVSQYKTIPYDYEKNRFGENQPLPAEQGWMLSGALPEDINMVELSIYYPDKTDKNPILTSDYRRPPGSNTTQFTIPVNENLGGNKAYTLTISYFENASSEEITRLREMIREALSAYLELSTVANRNKVDLEKHPKLMIQDLDKIVKEGLVLYRSKLGTSFPGFSSIVYDKLEKLENMKLKKAKFNVLGKADTDKNEREQEKRVEYFRESLTQLADIMDREVGQYLGNNFYVLKQKRVVKNYKTEKTRQSLPINFGYAAVYYDGNVDEIGDITDTQWSGAPMVGLSIPLGNPHLNSKFWSNSSISAGILLQDLDFGERTMTGPGVEKPLYLAFGYKTAYFLRLNAGTTILTEKGNSSNVEFSPFIGASIEINIWMGLNR